MKPRVLIVHTLGTNRDEETVQAFTMAGADPCVVPLVELRSRKRAWSDYQILVLPGGFSYADALGAGRLWALDLKAYFADELREFVDSGRPVLGICNGFQALVRAGLLGHATLTHNAGGSFQCRWVRLHAHPGSLWTRGLTEPIECPIAHGEGNFQTRETVPVAFTYEVNPNGSVFDAAGVTNERGNVLGLMPHPENHLFAWQHPLYARGHRGGGGLPLFEAGVRCS